jgi:uncharacterized SAM-binding protein YcdF (DUF218 family)
MKMNRRQGKPGNSIFSRASVLLSGPRSAPRLGRAVRISVVGFLIIGALILLADAAARHLVVEKTLSRADAILVLSGSDTYLERTAEAAALYSEGTAPKILLTNDGLQGGWNDREKRNPYFYERARWELIRQGVPEAAIEALPPVVRGTHDEAELFVEAAAERNIESVMLVTSAHHTRRALWTFERVAAKHGRALAIGIKSPPGETQDSSPPAWWLSGRGWRAVGLEYLKIAYYRLYF